MHFASRPATIPGCEMQAYQAFRLEAMLADTESDLVERKATWDGDAPEKGRQAVCAFANDLPGHGCPGVLIVGAHDDGRPSGLPIHDRLLQTLADIRTDGARLYSDLHASPRTLSFSPRFASRSSSPA